MIRHLLPMLILAGCAAQGPFPSLAPRPAEQIDESVEPVRPPAPVESDSGLRLRLLELRNQAARGERAFDVALGPAEAAVRRAGGAGSESWVEAQQALSRLEAARAEATDALEQLELLGQGRAEIPTNIDDLEAIAGITDVVRGIVFTQQRRIAPLLQRLSPD